MYHSKYRSRSTHLPFSILFRRCRRFNICFYSAVISCSVLFNGFLLLILTTRNLAYAAHPLILERLQRNITTTNSPKFLTVDSVNICFNRSRSLHTNYQIKLRNICPCFSSAIDIPPIEKFNFNFNIEFYDPVSLREGYDNKVQGCWIPSECVPRWRIAVLVPYRNRTSQLSIFLKYLPLFLRAQRAAFCIFIIEQSDDDLFNRGMLLNIGFLEARRFASEHAGLFNRHIPQTLSSQETTITSNDFFDCFALQDVDLLPLDGRILYQCASGPLHLAAGVDKYNFSLLYETYFGGVSILQTSMFQIINGYSNLYFGWGAEGMFCLIMRCFNKQFRGINSLWLNMLLKHFQL